MTISSETRKAGPFIGAGSTGPFPFTFKVFEASDVLVVTVNTSTSVQTTLTLTTDYTVSLNANQNANPGGSITLVSALAVGNNMVISSQVPYLQETDLTNQGGFYPEVITNSLDQLTIEAQQLREEVDRALTIPITTGANVSTELPEPIASAVIAWNEDGDALENVPLSAIVTTAVAGFARADIFSGNGSTTAFTLSANPGSQNNLDVSISGVTQKPGIDYTWTSGTTVTFTTAPPSASNNVLIRYTVSLPAVNTESANNIAGGLQNEIPYQTAPGATGFIPAGNTANLVLTCDVYGTPSWDEVPPVNDLAAGDIGYIPYQHAPDTTAFLAPGSAGQVFTTNGPGADPTWEDAQNGAFIDVAAIYPGLGRTAAAIQQALTDYPGRTLYLSGGPLDPPSYPNFWRIEATVNITTACSIVGDGEFTVVLPNGITNVPLFSVNTSKPVSIDNLQILGNHVTGIIGIQFGKGYGISSLTWAGGTATLTTSSPHNIPVGDYIRIVIKGSVASSPTYSYNTSGVWATSTGASTMTYSVAGNPGTVTTLGSMAVESESGHLTRLNVLACPTGFYSYQAGVFTITDCYFHDSDFACVHLANVLEPDHGDCSIMGCEFGGYGTTGFCIYQTGVGGIRIINNKFINGLDHWHVSPAGGDPVNDAFFIGNSTENAAGDHIHIDGTNGAPNNFVISNNQIGIDGTKTGITGINIIGTSVNDPKQMVISDNTIWVGGTNQTGINVNAGGFDQYAYCTIYVVNNNLYQWGQSSNPALPNYRTGQTAIAIQGSASVRCGANNINGTWANRFVLGSSSECRFDIGQSQNGSVTLTNNNVAPVGSFHASGWQAVTFPVAFPQTPNVNVVISGANTAGAITLLIQNVTATGFDVGAYCINTSGSTVVSWHAWLTGQ